MTDTHADQQFLQYLIGQIVSDQEAVEITRTIDDMGVLLTLKVSKDDMGRIIGKDGQTAKAIRTLLRVVGSRHDLRVNLKILEPEGSEHAPDLPGIHLPDPEEVLEAPDA